MRLVIAIDERANAEALARVPELMNVREAEILVLHVQDPAAGEEWEHRAGHHLLRTHPLRQGSQRMRAIDHDEAESIVARAAAQIATWGPQSLRTLLLEGSPGHEICALLDTEGAAALIVFVHGHTVGPKSIGREARFLIDHAACPVLVVKG